MIVALLKLEPLVSLESGIYQLSKNEQGKWNHRFYGSDNSC